MRLQQTTGRVDTCRMTRPPLSAAAVLACCALLTGCGSAANTAPTVYLAPPIGREPTQPAPPSNGQAKINTVKLDEAIRRAREADHAAPKALVEWEVLRRRLKRAYKGDILPPK